MLSASLLAMGMAVLGAHAGTGDHFILTRIQSMALARIDPIVNPGAVSGHVHNIMGGSCFNKNLNTLEEQQACDCSSTIIGDDRSNYWAPMLYYQSERGEVQPILGSSRIYYFTKGDKVKPFPRGMRMISGNAMYRNASDVKSFGVKISCDHDTQTQFLPNGTSHPQGCGGIAMGIYFPSCGLASGDLDSDDHFSHLAWPQAIPGGGAQPFNSANEVACPASHPIKYPTMFMEANYYLSDDQTWHGGNPLILSNGDMSGLTYHADFVEGWKPNLLGEIIDKCGDGHGPGEQLDECEPLARSMSEEATWWCRFQNEIPNEDVGLYRPLKELPGCNTKWPSDGPDSKPACEETNPPEFIYPNAQFTNLLIRERLPMLFTLAKNLSDMNELKEYVPALGQKGASYLRRWGFDGSNAASLKVSTLSEILEATEQQESGESASSSSSSAAASPSASSSAAASAAAVASSASVSKAAVSSVVGANLVAHKSASASDIANAKASPSASSAASQAAVSGVNLLVPSAPASSSSAVIASASSASASMAPAAASSSTESLADMSSSTASSALAQSTDGIAKVCRRNARRIVKRARGVSSDLKSHLVRRSRRGHAGH